MFRIDSAPAFRQAAIRLTKRRRLALARWHLGSPDRALALGRKATELARSLGQPFSLEYALHHAGWLFQHCRMGAQTQAAGEEEMRIATEQGFLFWHASGTLYAAAGSLLGGRLERGLNLFQKGLDAYRATGARLGVPYYLGILGETLTHLNRFDEAHRVLEEAFALVEQTGERFQEAELHRLRGELLVAESNDAAAGTCFLQALEIARRQGSLAWELRSAMSLARLRYRQGRRNEAFTLLTPVFGRFTEGFDTPDLVDAAVLLRDLGNERMREDFAAGLKYVHDCFPPPMTGKIAVDWRYVPASTLGGDTISYHEIDGEHLALYLIDVTGHGLDSALLSVTIANVIRSGSLPETDMRQPDQVLAMLNETFQGRRHGGKLFTIWYGVYHAPTRILKWAGGGHHPAVLIASDNREPVQLPSSGPMMGVLRHAAFPAESCQVPPGARLLIFSDGVFEIRRDKQMVWDLPGCIGYLADLSQRGGIVMDELLNHARHLRGSQQLDDDFSIIEVRIE